jgi:hypothetical protein
VAPLYPDQRRLLQEQKMTLTPGSSPGRALALFQRARESLNASKRYL